MCIQTGMQCGYFSGDTLKLTQDMQILKPTLFPSVPRLYNKIYGGIQAKFKGLFGLKDMLMGYAVNSKLQ